MSGDDFRVDVVERLEAVLTAIRVGELEATGTEQARLEGAVEALRRIADRQE